MVTALHLAFLGSEGICLTLAHLLVNIPFSQAATLLDLGPDLLLALGPSPLGLNTGPGCEITPP